MRVRGSGATYAANWSEPSAVVTVTTGTCPPPMFAETSYAFTVAEDADAGTQLGTVQATAAGGLPVTHTLTAGDPDAVWTLDATTGELKVAGTLDYETTSSYRLTVTAAVGGDGTATATAEVTVTVTNVDEPPAFAGDAYAFTVAEDTTIPTTLGTVTATDPEGDEVLYDISAGNPGGGVRGGFAGGPAGGGRPAGL